MMKSIRLPIITLIMALFLGVSSTAQSPATTDIIIWYAPESASYLAGPNGLIQQFNGSQNNIVVTGVSITSGEAADILSNSARRFSARQPLFGDLEVQDLPTIYQPSVDHWFSIINGELNGFGAPQLFDPNQAQPTAVSWVVIAVFDPYVNMFNNLTLGNVGWNTLAQLLQNPRWPNGEELVYAHFNPHQSSTALSSLIAIYNAIALGQGLIGPGQDLQGAIATDALQQAYEQLYDAITRQPQRAGGDTLTNLSLGPGYAHLLPLEEDVVINHNCIAGSSSNPPGTNMHLHAIYPQDGSFQHTRPMAIPEPGYWVNNAERQAAQTFIEFVRQPVNQQFISSKGFRPAIPNVQPDPQLFTANCGVSAQPSVTTLSSQTYGTMNTIQTRWTTRQSTDYIIVVDTSGSMEDCEKLTNAQVALQRLILGLDQDTTVELIEFANTSQVVYQRSTQSRANREALLRVIDDLNPEGGTALYDAVNLAIERARELKEADPDNQRQRRIIILSDGANNNGDIMDLENDLIPRIQSAANANFAEFFPIVYKADCDGVETDAEKEAQEDMQAIANAVGVDLIIANENDINQTVLDILNAWSR